MSIRDLRYVVALAEARHFGRAAALCNVTQPTLSFQIKKLEGYFGVPLFVRSSNGVSLTATGVSLLRLARIAVAAFDRMRALSSAERALQETRAMQSDTSTRKEFVRH